MGVYHTSQASVDTLEQSQTGTKGYRGVRHARLTRSMKQLPPALKTLLVELRFRLPDGESEHISNRVLARATGYSEGYVSLLIRQLAGETVRIQQRERVLTYAGVVQPFIRRVWDDAVGGFLLTMLAPPELRPTPERATAEDTHKAQASPTATPTSLPTLPVPPQLSDCQYIQLPMFPDDLVVGDHPHDPLPKTGDGASQGDPAPHIADHPHDPPHPSIYHADRMRRHGEREVTSVRLNEEPPAAFTLPESWALMLRGTPGYSHADYLRDRQKAESRKLREHPDHLIFWSISRGQPVYGADDLRNRERGWSAQGGSDGRGSDGYRAGDSSHSTGGWGGSADRRVDCAGALSTRARAAPSGGTAGKRAIPGAQRVEPTINRRPAMDELPGFLQPITKPASNQPNTTGGEQYVDERPSFLRLPAV